MTIMEKKTGFAEHFTTDNFLSKQAAEKEKKKFLAGTRQSDDTYRRRLTELYHDLSRTQSQIMDILNKEFPFKLTDHKLKKDLAYFGLRRNQKRGVNSQEEDIVQAATKEVTSCPEKKRRIKNDVRAFERDLQLLAGTNGADTSTETPPNQDNPAAVDMPVKLRVLGSSVLDTGEVPQKLSKKADVPFSNTPIENNDDDGYTEDLFMDSSQPSMTSGTTEVSEEIQWIVDAAAARSEISPSPDLWPSPWPSSSE